MKYQVYFGIAWRIILLASIAMLTTFITPYFREFLGDTPHNCNLDEYRYFCDNRSDAMDEAWEWGTRHYIYFWMMLSLFLLSLVNTIISVKNLIEKYYE